MWLDFVERKIETALRLDGGECNGSYSDGCTLLSALLSGIAADLWPGTGIDRRRFIELWVTYAGVALSPVRVSVPLLTQGLRGTGRDLEADALEAARPEMFGLGYSTRVLHATEVDMSENEVISLSGSLRSNDVRAFCYPAVFYKHVRSSLAHEYRLSADAASHFATRQLADVSYVNRYDPESPALSRRLIHFHIGWLADVVRSIAHGAWPLLEKYETAPRPNRWWIEG